MATTWPRELPLSVRDHPRRQAEVRTFDRLRAELDDQFTVFYSSPWLGEDRFGRERDGECDFLVCHAVHGILALEVKGGRISYDPALGRWQSRDRHGFVHAIRDPVEQARSAKHEMLRRLGDSPRWRRRPVHAAHGVVFPDSAMPDRDLGADRPARLFCGSSRFAADLRGWVGERLCVGARPAGCEPLGADGIAALERFLASPFHLHFPVSALMADAAERMGVLEPTQYLILDNIADIDRAEIRGGAGTGKTVIAAEEALHLARSGRRTLLTCHSAPLAADLQRRLSGEADLTVASFHSLCGTLAAKAGVRATGSGPLFYDEVLPAALMDAARLLPGERFDAVVVDEGQDFRQNWWIALTEVMAAEVRLRVMSDANQRVYGTGRVPGLDLELVPIRLTRNLRNTRAICDAASAHYTGPEIKAVGPDGPEVRWIELRDGQDRLHAAYRELRRLVHTEEVAPSDVAVLVPSADLAERFREVAARSDFEFVGADGLRSDATVLDTVRRFKGLERPAVILVIAPCDMMEAELAYVGFTRPRTFLAVVADAGALKWLRAAKAALEGSDPASASDAAGAG
ncbi:nuclease-related domain-containing DEAD/DEAH box helicase [Sphingomonas sp. BK069]|uniref:nuclease-related domain-containing DEAD/DEAH box helicase n=1 Tax=Sphingomonas sp. BK069 TaxID=2586979 RepID=UPI0016197FF1|nr:NERD domain-containing protein/DEAD/DEAH box helicase [Sphingomonas sp. BK069]MBB3349820.1 hypothetical protein [Sphingomonas sp. BK069]